MEDIVCLIKEQAKEIESLLRPDEKCTFAIEGDLIMNKKRKRRIFAVVINRRFQNEACFMVLQKKRGVTVFQQTYPILKDFLIEQVTSSSDQTTLESAQSLIPDLNAVIQLRFGKSTLLIELRSFDILAKLMAELKQMQVAAISENFGQSKSTHIWILYYSKSPEEIINLSEPDISGLIANRIHSPENVLENPLMNVNSQNGLQYVRESSQSIKQQWIKKQTIQREKAFTDYLSLTIFTGTWNVNGKTCSESLSPWLNPKNAESSVEPDLYVLGFQELDLSASAFLLDNSVKDEEWSKSIEASLKNRNQYRKVASKQLVGMLIIIYAKNDLFKSIKEVVTGSAGTGILGMMGNKGGVAVRMKIYDSYFCFINSHLAAGSDELERRNLDYKDISQKISFPYPDPTQPQGIAYYSIFDSDYLIWLGDFNYRVSLNDSEVRTYVDKKEYSKLLQYDQLNLQRLSRKAFGGFEESPISFHPSYKYDPGTDTFDTSEKKRAPAWCDRILWRSGDKLLSLGYTCHMELKTSDHKPISNLFLVEKVKVFSKEKMAEVQMEIVRELDKFENECMPDATLSENSIDFKFVKYLVPLTREISLENIGQVLLQFEFIPKLEESRICKPWIWVSPTTGMLVPGEKTTISITVLVDNRTVSTLNKGDGKLEDILVLHLQNGKDFFVSVFGDFQKTCFGVPIEALLKSPPVRQTQSSKPQTTNQLSIPKELWRLTDYIYREGLSVDGLFVTSGEFEEMEMIRDCLDEGKDFDFGMSHTSMFSVCETLLRFLEALPEPVVPFSMYQRCLDSYQSYQLARAAVSQIPASHYNVFIYLTAFLREVLTHSTENGLTTESLALIFSVVLMRSPRTVAERYKNVVDKKKAAFLAHFLNTGSDPFM